MTRPVGFIDEELFEEVCRNVSPNQCFISLHHFGESLLHPKLPTLIQIAGDHGLHTGLSCNAVYLRDELTRKLIDSGLSSITFNLDSFSTDTYQHIRGTHHTAENNLKAIETFTEVNRRQTQPCLVSVQMIAMRSNRKEWKKILAWAKQIGLDRALVVQFGQWDFSDEEALKLADLGTRKLYDVPCSVRWESVSILWDGTVVPCCRDYNGDLPMGNVAIDSLEKIWCASLFEKLRFDQISFKRCCACWQSWPYRVNKREEIGFKSFHNGSNSSSEMMLEWTPDGALARYKSIGFPVKFRIERQKENVNE
jgi:MoaA/NifB/PqqE/SkfB family radical SAM enzyme